MTHPPTISVHLDADEGDYVLLATSYGKTEPCGARLFRGGDAPDVAFRHPDREQAQRDCVLLQQYVNLTHGKAMSKQKVRKGARE